MGETRLQLRLQRAVGLGVVALFGKDAPPMLRTVSDQEESPFETARKHRASSGRAEFRRRIYEMLH